jgi:hypothetical protein
MDGFLTTMLATFAGAALAGVVAWLVFVREGVRAYNVRLDDALVAFLLAIPARIKALEDHDEMLRLVDTDAPGRHPDTYALAPGPYDLGIAIEAVRVIARSEDAKTISEIATVFYSIVSLPPLVQRAKLLHLAEMVRKWRQGVYGKHPWAHFEKVARETDERRGMTPPPPWESRR